MRLRVAASVAVFLLAAGVLALALFGSSLQPSQASREGPPARGASGNPIVVENAHAGTSSWQIPAGKEASTQIQAYASATSVQPGQQLTFYVSTQKEGTDFAIDIYRLGWYQGLGGRLMASAGYRPGRAQGYYDVVQQRLVGCNSCLVQRKTGLVEANWQASYALTVPSDWTTGIYLAKFTDDHGMQTYAPFDVRGDLHSTYLAVTPDTTYAAYNAWGGWSLYQANSPIGLSETASVARGIKVSFDRPYTDGDGSSQVLQYEAVAIRWLERRGYDLSYISDVDVQKDAAQLLQHHAYLSLGHDEYWTKEMRDGVEQARDHGTGLAFFGADAAYWQMRFEPDSASTPDRTVVCYKVETDNHDLAADPFFGKDNSRVTAQWRDPVLNRPENALIGIMFSDLTSQRMGFPWQVSSRAQSTLLEGTGLQPGQQYGCDLVGYEWDRIFPNGATPEGLQVIGTTKTLNDLNQSDVSDTTYYIAPSGAMVFATGSNYWAMSLDPYRFQTDGQCPFQRSMVPGMQKLMANVMQALATNHPSHTLALTRTAFASSGSGQGVAPAEVSYPARSSFWRVPRQADGVPTGYRVRRKRG